MTVRPHDALFKAAFEDPKNAADELRHVLPEPIAAAIDWETLTHEPGSFIDPELADRQSDLLFSARIGDTPALVYLLLEHQSTADASMPLRMLVYMTRIWERSRSESPQQPLPVILPVVVSHAAGGWTAPLHFRELLATDPSTIPGLADLVPDFRLLVDDLAHVSNDDLRARALQQFPTLALWLLRDSRTAETLLTNLAEWTEAFHDVASASTGLQALTRLLRYVALVVPDLHFDEFRAKLVELAPETETAAMTIAEQLRAEGRAEGRAEERAVILVKLLTLKFGPLAPEVQARVSAANTATVERWLERVLTADTLDAVLAE